MFILQGLCLHLQMSGKANETEEQHVTNRRYNANLSFQPSLSRAELVLEQNCNNGDEETIMIQDRVKHLITSPGFPDMYPRNAL